MDEGRVTRIHQYALGLINEANKSESMDVFLKDVHASLDVFNSSDLIAFLDNNMIENSEKSKVISLFKDMGSTIITDFIEDIIQHNDYALVYDVFNEVINQSQSVMGEYDLTVTSVVPLSEEQRQRMIQLVEKKFHLRVRRVIEVLDEKLLGGFILDIKHRTIDASLRHQLQVVKEKIK